MQEELLNVVNKIDDYNASLEQLNNMYGEDINEIIKSLLFKYCIKSYEQCSKNNQILNRISFYLNFRFYGLYDEYNIDKDNIETGLEPVKYITLDDIERIIKNDYTSEYGRCYKNYYLNIIEYLHLIILVLDNQINRINLSIEANISNEILVNYNRHDLGEFNKALNKIKRYRDQVVYEVISQLNLENGVKSKLLTLLYKTNINRLTEEDNDILCKYIDQKSAKNIIDDIYSYKQIDTNIVRNSKVKQYI